MREQGEKFYWACEQLRELAARTGEGLPLPSRARLAAQLGVSRVTLERAVAQLACEGVLRSRGGSGTYVLGRAPADGLAASQELPPRLAPRDEKRWALMLSSVTHFSYPLLIRGCEDYANEHGINLIICNTDDREDKQSEYLAKLAVDGVSGLILVPTRGRSTNWRLFEALGEAGVSIVVCNRALDGFNYPCILMNFYQSGFMATDHLLEAGCRRICFLAPPNYATVMQRYQGYLTALEARGLARSALAFYTRSVRGPACEREIEAFLAVHPEIDGAFAFNDGIALAAYAALKRLRRQIGEDVRVVSCDNTEVCAALGVPLSSIEFPNYKMGRCAAELLGRLRAGESADSLPCIVLSGRLVARESSAGRRPS